VLTCAELTWEKLTCSATSNLQLLTSYLWQGKLVFTSYLWNHLCSTMIRPSFVPSSHPSHVQLHSRRPSALLRLIPLFLCARPPCFPSIADYVSLVLVPSPRSFSFARHMHHPSVHLPPLRLALSLSSLVSIHQHARY
jgi:hypothetical protein